VTGPYVTFQLAKFAVPRRLFAEILRLIHALLDDAKMLLAGAKHNHEKLKGAYDHARAIAIAKGDAARGYAAADIYHFKLTAKIPKMRMKK
jgi:hypothetical protein